MYQQQSNFLIYHQSVFLLLFFVFGIQQQPHMDGGEEGANLEDQHQNLLLIVIGGR